MSVATLCRNSFNVITSGLFEICICTVRGIIPWGLEMCLPGLSPVRYLVRVPRQGAFTKIEYETLS